MGRRKILSFGGLIAILASVGILLAVSVTREPGNGVGAMPASEHPAGPELLLRDVEMREIPKDGRQFRLVSGRADYRVASRELSADNVTLFLPGSTGEMTVRCPRVSWDMDAGRIVLSGGGEAEDAAGWRADVSAASFFLKDHVMTAEGEARLSGPGIRVSGDNLVWGWREGKMSLSNPRTRVDSPRDFRGKR